MDALRYLSWDIVLLLAAIILVGLALRRWAGASGARIGAALVWLTFAATAVWAALTIYRATTLMLR